MRLFHNADLSDLESIVNNGLLPMSTTKNDRWENGKRAKNSTEVVYLFDPLGSQNSFTRYGAALVVGEVDKAEHTAMSATDINNGMYEEYTAPYVLPERIVKIMIPSIFKSRVVLSETVLALVEWCDIKFDVFRECVDAIEYSEDVPSWRRERVSVYTEASVEEIERFAKSADAYIGSDRYLRGIDESGDVFDIANVRYIEY